MFSQAERSSNGTDSSSSLHLLVPTALLFKVRLKKKNQNQKKKKNQQTGLVWKPEDRKS